ncbi:MAG: hypothetical protein MJ244_02580 [Clostridia bacterium]|nr:hypothetical protein [Clostridia bacterium]
MVLLLENGSINLNGRVYETLDNAFAAAKEARDEVDIKYSKILNGKIEDYDIPRIIYKRSEEIEEAEHDLKFIIDIINKAGLPITIPKDIDKDYW